MEKTIHGLPADFDPRYNKQVSKLGQTETAGVCGWVREYRGLRPREFPLDLPDQHGNIEDRIKRRYAVMPLADNYAEGAHALREACEKEKNSLHPTFVREDGSMIYRPLTFAENLAARLEDESLFDGWLWTCTGIAYKGGTTKFKIIPECKELINLPEGFDEPYLNNDYGRIKGKEFDSSRIRCNQLQSRLEAKNDPLWLAAAGGKKEVLSDNVDYVFDWLEERGANEGMCFFVREKVAEDQLRALFVDDLDGHSDADGDYYLDDDALFLRVAQAAEPHR